jgi:hypothetical protein
MKITVIEVSKRVGVCSSLVYGWVESRALAHFRLGGKGKRGRILVDEADLEAFLQGCRVEAKKEAASSMKPPRVRTKFKHLDL